MEIQALKVKLKKCKKNGCEKLIILPLYLNMPRQQPPLFVMRFLGANENEMATSTTGYSSL